MCSVVGTLMLKPASPTRSPALHAPHRHQSDISSSSPAASHGRGSTGRDQHRSTGRTGSCRCPTTMAGPGHTGTNERLPRRHDGNRSVLPVRDPQPLHAPHPQPVGPECRRCPGARPLPLLGSCGPATPSMPPPGSRGPNVDPDIVRRVLTVLPTRDSSFEVRQAAVDVADRCGEPAIDVSYGLGEVGYRQGKGSDATVRVAPQEHDHGDHNGGRQHVSPRHWSAGNGITSMNLEPKIPDPRVYARRRRLPSRPPDPPRRHKRAGSSSSTSTAPRPARFR